MVGIGVRRGVPGALGGLGKGSLGAPQGARRVLAGGGRRDVSSVLRPPARGRRRARAGGRHRPLRVTWYRGALWGGEMAALSAGRAAAGVRGVGLGWGGSVRAAGVRLGGGIWAGGEGLVWMAVVGLGGGGKAWAPRVRGLSGSGGSDWMGGGSGLGGEGPG